MRLLDLFCGAGGAAVGYWRAGWDVTGVDLAPQPFYPFEFIQGNALALDYKFLMRFDAIHASPPCQQYSSGSALARKRGKVYPDLIHPVRAMLKAYGGPYIIENVVGAPVHGIGLCGTMFGLGVRRHRIFESNVTLPLPETPCTCYEHRGEFVTVAGEQYRKGDGAAAMGIDWPIDKHQLTEAIPPAYTQYLGEELRIIVSERDASISDSRSHTVSGNQVLSVSDRRCDSVSENPGRIVSEWPGDNVSVSEHPGCTVSEWPGENVSVSEHPGCTVSEPHGLSVSDERRCVPVTRRCAYCKKPLPQGTARRRYCGGPCRLNAFKSRRVASA